MKNNKQGNGALTSKTKSKLEPHPIYQEYYTKKYEGFGNTQNSQTDISTKPAVEYLDTIETVNFGNDIDADRSVTNLEIDSEKFSPNPSNFDNSNIGNGDFSPKSQDSDASVDLKTHPGDFQFSPKSEASEASSSNDSLKAHAGEISPSNNSPTYESVDVGQFSGFASNDSQPPNNNNVKPEVASKIVNDYDIERFHF